MLDKEKIEQVEDSSELKSETNSSGRRIHKNAGTFYFLFQLKFFGRKKKEKYTN